MYQYMLSKIYVSSFVRNCLKFSTSSSKIVDKKVLSKVGFPRNPYLLKHTGTTVVQFNFQSSTHLVYFLIYLIMYGDVRQRFAEYFYNVDEKLIFRVSLTRFASQAPSVSKRFK